MSEFNKLIISKEQISASIIDEEGDKVECFFNYDGCIHIDTNKYTYLTLSYENLETMLKLTSEAECKYEMMFK